jgi:DNA-binding NarL/FixJ family response regulator
VARAVAVSGLLSLEVEDPPDLVLLHAAEQAERACDQVRRIKAAWPATRCIALVEGSRQRELIQAAGADEVLLKGASPKRLTDVVQRLRPTEGSEKATDQEKA